MSRRFNAVRRLAMWLALVSGGGTATNGFITRQAGVARPRARGSTRGNFPAWPELDSCRCLWDHRKAIPVLTKRDSGTVPSRASLPRDRVAVAIAAARVGTIPNRPTRRASIISAYREEPAES